MQVKNRYPGLQVVLFKNVGRSKLSGAGKNAIPVSQRYRDQNPAVDVTQYVGEQGVVNVNKSVHEPAGSFSIDFTDRLVQEAADSIYGLFEPQDMVEIRMTATSYKKPIPIMMRGFISHVSRSQSIGGDGRPQRKVTIAGQDYGKIWQIDNIYYNPWMPDEANYITTFKLFTRFGIAFATSSAGKLVTDVFTAIINPFIAHMQSNPASQPIGGIAPLVPIKIDVQTEGGNVAPFGVGDWQGGSIHALLSQYGDVGSWNELFIEDRTDGPYVVYRPNPYIVAGGDVGNPASYIQKATNLAASTAIASSDIISMDVSRTDANVANYFWVEAPAYNMNFGWLGKAMAGQSGPANTFIITGYGNVDSTLYGFKRMTEQTNQLGPGNGVPKEQNEKAEGEANAWIAARRKDLLNQNRDNVVLESGSVRLVGNESVKAGTYLLITHGNMTSTYYVPSVSHSFTPFGTYVTTATVERGTGFIDRAGRDGGRDSPYLAELADSQA
jgi:hypothetical protein